MAKPRRLEATLPSPDQSQGRVSPLGPAEGMQLALAEARAAAAAGEVPVGAILTFGNRVLARAHNRVERDQRPSAHAEVLAVEQACEQLGQKWLPPGACLFVTLEPCPMCAGLLSQARLSRLVYGAYDPKSGGVDHGPRVFDHPQSHFRPQVISGVLEQDCAALLTDFFAARRTPGPRNA